MIAVNYTNLREHLKEYCDKATKDFETIIITRKNNENVVMLSEAEYNNMLENLYVRSNKSNYARLLKSIDQLEKGQTMTKELIEDEEDFQ